MTVPTLTLNLDEMRRDSSKANGDDSASTERSRGSHATQGLSASISASVSASIESSFAPSHVAAPSSVASSDSWDSSLLESLSQLPSKFVSQRVRTELRPIVDTTLRRAVKVEIADEECAGGTYFVEDARQGKLAVFKPYDEEPGAHNNGKGSGETRGLVSAGSGYIREVAAYLLDHGGFAGVPPTTFMRMPNRLFKTRDARRPAEPYKVGALQMFIPDCRPSWDLTPKQFPTAHVHRIAILDIRLCNSDRHGGNLLARFVPDSAPEVIPIDHGFTLPSTLADLDFEWLMWPHSKEPLGEDEIAYVKALDIDRDLELLKVLGIGARSLELFKAACTLLKIAVEAGATVRAIGEYMRRETLDQPSKLEQLLADVRRPLDEGGALDWARLTSGMLAVHW